MLAKIERRFLSKNPDARFDQFSILDAVTNPGRGKSSLFAEVFCTYRMNNCVTLYDLNACNPVALPENKTPHYLA